MKKSFWIYGLLTGLLLIILQAIHFKAMIRDIRLEVFGLIIAVVFTIIGAWVGIQIFHRKQRNFIHSGNAQKSKLSKREIEVLDLLAQGFSNQEIADKLFVSLNTTKTHISKIYQKLEVTRRTQAVQKARELAIIRSSEEVTS